LRSAAAAAKDGGMRAAHVVAGILGFAIFLGTGLYMAFNFPGLFHGNQAIRYQFRANHVDILLCSVVNLLVGLHLARPIGRWRASLQALGSLLLLAALPVLVIAFFVEPPRSSPDRLITTGGVVLILVATVLHALSRGGARA
jgi:hypothetical protein